MGEIKDNDLQGKNKQTQTIALDLKLASSLFQAEKLSALKRLIAAVAHETDIRCKPSSTAFTWLKRMKLSSNTLVISMWIAYLEKVPPLRSGYPCVSTAPNYRTISRLKQKRALRPACYLKTILIPQGLILSPFRSSGRYWYWLGCMAGMGRV
jgi:hypothetical protein